MQPSNKQNARKEQPKEDSFASHVVQRVAKAAVGTVASAVVGAVLGPVVGEITRIVITGGDDVIG